MFETLLGIIVGGILGVAVVWIAKRIRERRSEK